ncbi:MAG TPA: cation:proton antiporter [Longimicrobium sp.]|nr:cation:proton antiporter [Longimicrobium sp.]
MRLDLKSLTTYVLLVAVSLAALAFVLHLGAGLTAPEPVAGAGHAAAAGAGGRAMHLGLLLVQIAAVVIAARGVGYLFRLIRQPQVVGEMVAGILLGPSFLGWIAPGLSAQLFPPGSLGFLNSISQVGLLVFMFLVGLELNPRLLRGRGHTAVVTSHASIVVPFVLGGLLSLHLYPRLSDRSVGFTGFALFMGAAMSVTAFPVLARILTERDLVRTRVGTVTLACAAVDDVTAWCILAVVVAIAGGGGAGLPPWASVAGAAAYAALMVLVVRRLLAPLERRFERDGQVTQDVLGFILLVALASAWVTEALGVHALFGAFMAGAVMPKGKAFMHALNGKLQDVTVVLLLPLFFAFTGLRTRIGLVEGAEMWGWCALVVLVAVAGKFGGSAAAARLTGMSWREAGAIGTLMNTRGLMELVILNIGLDIGVISPTVFAMMVMMALATTFMTSPLLEVIYPPRLIRRAAGEEHEEDLS